MFEGNSVLRQLIAEACVIGAFQASCADYSVNFHGSAENARRNRIVQHRQRRQRSKGGLRVLLSSVVERVSASSSPSRMQAPLLGLTGHGDHPSNRVNASN